MFRSHVILSVFKRNVSSYFSGVLGYLFIIAFVVAGAVLAFSREFFTNNLANLDQLNEWFPMLLLFLIPAITMGVWADEKKSGTDELLFTLPASDAEILLGKYLAVLAVYTVTLAFSVTHLMILGWIGSPDWWLMGATYFGYWIAGAALLSVGMFASVLTHSATVAYVLGAAFSAVPVFIGYAAPANDFIRGLSISEQLRDFFMGIISPSSVIYFVALTALMLYLNLVFISRRHWSAGQEANMGLQFGVRTLSLAAILVSLGSVSGFATLFRFDMTSEELYSLSPTTEQLFEKIEDERPVDIQAFLSPEVPRDYVPVRKRLVGLLREYDQRGGKRINVRLVDVAPYSKAAEEAKLLGIEPRTVQTQEAGRRIQKDVYLGAVITSSYDEVTIPFFGRGTPIEYELTRSVHTVSNEERLTVGVLETDAELMAAGGMGGGSQWQIITELEKQYNVESVSPDSEIAGDQYDVLLAAMPSSLTQPQMENFVQYVRSGRPVLIFDDPFPWVFNRGFGVSKAPRQPKPSPGRGHGMMGRMRRQQAPPKADGGKATTLLNTLEIAWDYDQIVWDQYNPYPEFFSVVPPEFLFVSRKSNNPQAINEDSKITGGLEEILAAFSGTIQRRADSDLQFEPLLQTSSRSGLLDWSEFTQSGFDPSSMQPTARLVPNPARSMDSNAHIVAARVTSGQGESNGNQVNAVYVADLDLISDWFFQERQRAQTNLRLDNVNFVLNAVDILAGDDSYIDLRTRKAEHRTLEVIEKQTAEFVKKRNESQEQAEEEAQEALQAARQRFEKRRKEIRNSDEYSQREKQVMLENIRATEQRRLDVKEAQIERDKQREIQQVKAETERQIRKVEDWYRFWAVAIPPIPAVALGLVVLISRVSAERREFTSDRLVQR